MRSLRCSPTPIRSVPFWRAALAVATLLLLSITDGRAQGRGGLQGLEQQLAQISRQAQGRVGVAALMLETGESVAVLGNERFPMQSVYKLPIAMAVLSDVDQGALRLNQAVPVTRADLVGPQQHSPIRDAFKQDTAFTVSELLRYMVSESDGSACDVLLTLLGGPAVVTAYVNGLGISDMRIATTEKQMGAAESAQYQNWTTPTATVQLLRALYGRALSGPSQKLLLTWMAESPTGPNRIRAGVPARTYVAHKTGSSRTVNGLTAATNDVGLIRLYDGLNYVALAVFVSGARANEATRERVIADITRAVWQFWN